MCCISAFPSHTYLCIIVFSLHTYLCCGVCCVVVDWDYVFHIPIVLRKMDCIFFKQWFILLGKRTFTEDFILDYDQTKSPRFNM